MDELMTSRPASRPHWHWWAFPSTTPPPFIPLSLVPPSAPPSILPPQTPISHVPETYTRSPGETVSFSSGQNLFFIFSESVIHGRRICWLVRSRHTFLYFVEVRKCKTDLRFRYHRVWFRDSGKHASYDILIPLCSSRETGRDLCVWSEWLGIRSGVWLLSLRSFRLSHRCCWICRSSVLLRLVGW